MWETFETLSEVVERIREREDDAEKMIWNNEGGDWDLEDMEVNADMYDEMKEGNYVLNIFDYNVIEEGTNYTLFRFEGFGR